MRLRKLLLLVSVTLCSINMMAQEVDCTVDVRIAKANPTDMFYVAYRNRPGSMKFDSVLVAKGRAIMKIQVPSAQRVFGYVVKANTGFAKLRPITEPSISFYAETGKVQLGILENHKDAKRGGTPLNKDYQALTDVVMPFKQKEVEMEKEFTAAKKTKDDAKMKELQQQYQTMDKERKAVEKNFAMTHPDSQISLEWMERTVDIVNNKTEAQAMFSKLSERLRNSDLGKRYGMKIQGTQTVEVGSVAPDFTGKTPKGEQVSLKSYRGKYVLVDFWASWCVPCRHENPNVVKAYAKYKSDKFDILGVSLDQDKAAWENAIAKDGLAWNQISDLMGWQSTLAMTYAVHSIPANFLIDPQGKIVARDLRGDDLEKKLNEVLK